LIWSPEQYLVKSAHYEARHYAVFSVFLLLPLLLIPHILLSTLFTNTLNLSSSLRAWGRASNLYKTILEDYSVQLCTSHVDIFRVFKIPYLVFNLISFLHILLEASSYSRNTGSPIHLHSFFCFTTIFLLRYLESRTVSRKRASSPRHFVLDASTYCL
jgi:hypothetical protein